jgi:hypothetical protein
MCRGCRGAHKDRLEIKRLGSSNVEASITLEQDLMPQAYALDPRLAEVRCFCMHTTAWCAHPASSFTVNAAGVLVLQNYHVMLVAAACITGISKLKQTMVRLEHDSRAATLEVDGLALHVG